MTGPVRVLNVDDDADFAELTARCLERADDRLAVETATSAGEGLERLADAEFDCVVSDHDMPGVDGIEFLETVRERDGDLPFVLFTGSGSETIAGDAISAGVTDYLRKQTGTDQFATLADRIVEAVEGSGSRREPTPRLEALHGATRELLDASTREAIAAVAVEAARDLLDAPVAAVYLHDADEGVLVPVAATDGGRERFATSPVSEDGESHPAEAFGSGTLAVHEDVAGHADEEIRSEVDLPLGDHGVMTIGSTRPAAFDDADTSLARILGTSVESALTRVEQREELEQFETICESLQDGIYVFDEDYRLAYCNESYASMKGRPREELLGRHLADLAGEAVFERGRRLREEMIAGERETAVVKYDLRSLDGEIIPVENRFVPLPYEDEFRGTTGVVRDVSERKEHERELTRKNQRLERFASIVSHDLRNPLSVAEGRLELARESGDREHFDAVARAHERMRLLIEDLLALAREGETPADVETVALADAIEECWRNVATAEAALVCETDRDVRADPGQLNRLLENLVRNAVEHGGPDVTVTVGELEDGFYVADDGPGIPEDERERVFESGYSSDRDGTGFGLSIAREVADDHGWKITATEAEGGGARFEVTGVEWG